MFLLRRITNTILMSFRTCFGIAMLFPKDHVTLKLVQGHKIFQKPLAFTLAETLIVMGIIGVVAALTIPNLNSSTADKEKIAKVMKLYSNLQDAFGRSTAVYGPMDEWFNGLSSNDAYTQDKLIADLRGTSQTGWIVKNGNMDYLKIDSSGKCPNGKVLNWSTNTSCK